MNENPCLEQFGAPVLASKCLVGGQSSFPGDNLLAFPAKTPYICKHLQDLVFNPSLSFSVRQAQEQAEAQQCSMTLVPFTAGPPARSDHPTAPPTQTARCSGVPLVASGCAVGISVV